jgi:hypothetical protein
VTSRQEPSSTASKSHHSALRRGSRTKPNTASSS